MKILGKEFFAAKVENIDKPQPPRSQVVEKVVKQQVIRQREDVKKWRDATQVAERVHPSPDRANLVRIYKDIVLDAHLSSLMTTVHNKCKAGDYWLCNADGTVNDDETVKLHAPWFKEFVGHAIDSIFWGHSLIQLGSIKDDAFTDIKLVPRENVVPEMHIVKKNVFVGPTSNNSKGAIEFIDYEHPLYQPWVVSIGKVDDFGLLHKAGPLVLWKKNAMVSWAQYAELFGMPIRVGKTNILDPDKKANMEAMLDNMGSAAYGIFDEDDLIEFVEANNEDAYNVFLELANLVNAELSKLVLGQTMTSDDGSSQSQATVHENVLNDYISAIKYFLEDCINSELLPRMEKHGMIPSGLRFKWDNEEKVTIEQQFQMVVDLLNAGKNVPNEFITEKFGIELDEVVIPEAQPEPIENKTETSSIINKVFDLYAGADKHTH